MRLLLEDEFAELNRIELLLLATEEDDLSFGELDEPTESIRPLLERSSIGIKDDDEDSSLETIGLLEPSSPQAIRNKVKINAKQIRRFTLSPSQTFNAELRLNFS
jgi:hypothetical protein